MEINNIPSDDMGLTSIMHEFSEEEDMDTKIDNDIQCPGGSISLRMIFCMHM